MTKGAGAKSYMTKIFFPIYEEKFLFQGKIPLKFPLYMTKNAVSRGKIPSTFLLLGENSPKLLPIYEEKYR
jgi:hypothetical protein